MDIPLPENQSKWGVSITFIHHQSIMYICHSIRFLMKRKYLLPAPLPLTSAFYFSIGAMDDQYCFVLWKRQAAVTNETGRLSFSSGRSFFSLLNKGSLYPRGFPAVLLLMPEHPPRMYRGFPTSANAVHHPLPPLQGREREARQDGVPAKRVTLPLLHPPFSCHPFLTGCRSYQGSIKPGGLWPRRGG